MQLAVNRRNMPAAYLKVFRDLLVLRAPLVSLERKVLLAYRKSRLKREVKTTVVSSKNLVDRADNQAYRAYRE